MGSFEPKYAKIASQKVKIDEIEKLKESKLFNEGINININ